LAVEAKPMAKTKDSDVIWITHYSQLVCRPHLSSGGEECEKKRVPCQLREMLPPSPACLPRPRRRQVRHRALEGQWIQ
jgi:hypothetical protein